MDFEEYSDKDEAAYITIVEGPPPEFVEVDMHWTDSLTEGASQCVIAMCETRTLNGEALVERCRQAWSEGRPARLDFPLGEGERAEVDIAAARWEQAPEGQKLILWVKVDEIQEEEESDYA